MTAPDVWPDDMRYAAITWAFAFMDIANVNDAVATAVDEGLATGRGREYVCALVQTVVTALVGPDLIDRHKAVTDFQLLAVQSKAHEDQLRADNEWRDE